MAGSEVADTKPCLLVSDLPQPSYLLVGAAVHHSCLVAATAVDPSRITEQLHGVSAAAPAAAAASVLLLHLLALAQLLHRTAAARARQGPCCWM